MPRASGAQPGDCDQLLVAAHERLHTLLTEPCCELTDAEIESVKKSYIINQPQFAGTKQLTTDLLPDLADDKDRSEALRGLAKLPPLDLGKSRLALVLGRATLAPQEFASLSNNMTWNDLQRSSVKDAVAIMDFVEAGTPLATFDTAESILQGMTVTLERMSTFLRGGGNVSLVTNRGKSGLVSIGGSMNFMIGIAFDALVRELELHPLPCGFGAMISEKKTVALVDICNRSDFKIMANMMLACQTRLSIVEEWVLQWKKHGVEIGTGFEKGLP